MRLQVVLLIGILQCTLADCVLASPPTLDELLGYWRERQHSLTNVALTTEWKEFKGGKLIGSEQESLHSDEFGRIRVKAIGGPVGRPAREIVETYNGELSIRTEDDPNRTKLGNAKDAASAEDKDRYLVAMINDGLGPDGKGPFRRRNPLQFVESGPISQLERLLDASEAVSVRFAEGSDNIVEITYRQRTTDDPQQFTHRCLVDRSKGWAIFLHETLRAGEVIGRSHCDLKEVEGGFWIPSRGDWQNWIAAASPAEPDMEWKFEVLDVKLNDKNFDENIFQVRLKPGTYVDDNRYHVSYTVGNQGAVDKHLSELAQLASAKEAANTARLESYRSGRVPQNVGYRWLILIAVLNAAFVGIAIVVWRMRQEAA